MKFKKVKRKKLSTAQQQQIIDGQKKYLEAKQSVLTEFWYKHGSSNGIISLVEKDGNMGTSFIHESDDLFKKMSQTIRDLYERNKGMITVVFFDEHGEHGYTINKPPEDLHTLN